MRKAQKFRWKDAQFLVCDGRTHRILGWAPTLHAARQVQEGHVCRFTYVQRATTWHKRMRDRFRNGTDPDTMKDLIFDSRYGKSVRE